eukprot:gnl/MRDRNA2_/MRDRNA2_196245_c0_seq1.p1 gnl/MRDRNA2_/MRDRNA2_196245_c0~~gnl/MRDRNA2_/MRDRNA2_196245_c0_seq1.p1  ORF type:complete len:293 (+),score=48.30 gnl/MRDRNA2_/MRDRNA2_196245_c0_seq1:118-996(+)
MEEQYKLDSQDALCRSGCWCSAEQMWVRSWDVHVPVVGENEEKMSVSIELLEDPSDTDDHGKHFLWPSSLALGRFVEAMAHEESWSSTRPSVLELGAGCGLVSLTASLLGARTLATDRAEVLPFLQHNMQRNKHVLEKAALPPDLRIETLHWGCDLENLPTVDIVLASEVCYRKELHHVLAQTIAALLAIGSPHSRCFIMHDDTCVPGADSLGKRFFAGVCHEHKIRVTRHLCVNSLLPERWASPDIFLYELRIEPQAGDKSLPHGDSIDQTIKSVHSGDSIDQTINLQSLD